MDPSVTLSLQKLAPPEEVLLSPGPSEAAKVVIGIPRVPALVWIRSCTCPGRRHASTAFPTADDLLFIIQISVCMSHFLLRLPVPWVPRLGARPLSVPLQHSLSHCSGRLEASVALEVLPITRSWVLEERTPAQAACCWGSPGPGDDPEHLALAARPLTGLALSPQSSLYSEEGLGVAALSTLYGAMLLSSLFLPPILIAKLGCKWTIVISMCCYVAFSLGNFYASWYARVQGTYLTIMGNTHAEKTGKVGKDVVSQYFGIFFLIFQSSGVWGNLISSLVFGQTPTQGAIPEEQLESCGAGGCLGATASTNSTNRPSQELIYTLLGIYTAIALSTPLRTALDRGTLWTRVCVLVKVSLLVLPPAPAAASQPLSRGSCVLGLLRAQAGEGAAAGSGFLAVLLTAAFLEPIKDTEQKSEGEKQAPPFWSTLLSTVKLFRDKRLCLLVLLPLYCGFQQAFLAGDYTQSYTTCALGIQFVGYVMICFSAVNALCSVLYGKLAQYTGRIALFALGAVTQLSCFIALLLWKPHPRQLPLFFAFPGLWGMADAVWQTQNNVALGLGVGVSLRENGVKGEGVSRGFMLGARPEIVLQAAGSLGEAGRWGGREGAVSAALVP
ncbi:hypothetical protein J1605_020620 [Eschrichtius robustus]|uniref:Protein unc-93 homolog A n=1 Tax=Eschrichtius robustus TaxID=9764 RepID=A0AB34HLV7_ESCRO|nr:hypothetical protein J1605_020620 [Eschrichtius robustus]